MDPARYGGICRHFLNGSCRFGSRCRYRHEWTIIHQPQICRYFQKGECWYGEHCRYLHIRQPDIGTAVSGRRGSVPAVSSSVAHSPSDRRGSEPSLLPTIVASMQVCSGSESTSNASNNQSNNGPLPHTSKQQPQEERTVQNSGIAQASSCQRIEESSSELEPQEGGSGGAAAAAATVASSNCEEESEAFLQSKNVICGICMEKVYDKENTREHVFGLLQNCNHPFCLKCIATWRKTKDFGSDVVRACPQCRVKSAFYVPSKVWIEGAAKDSAVAAFKNKFSKKRCSLYDRCGYCPFKADCLYSHVRTPGRVAFQYLSDDDDDEDDNGVDLLGLFLAMTLLGGDDSNDEDFPFFLSTDRI